MAKIYYPTEGFAVVGSSLVAAVDNTTIASGYIAMANWEFIAFVINTTDANADTTVNAKVQSADDSGGTNVADITGLAITQFTAAATAKQAILVVRADQLNTGDTHVRCLVTCGNGTSGSVTSIVAIGVGSNYLSAADYDASTVVEIKSL